MKSLPVFAAILLVTVVSTFAQKPKPIGGGMLGALQRAAENLSPEEKQQFEAAFQKAKVDPDFVAARQDRDAVGREVQYATNQLMVKHDPSLQPILDQLSKPSVSTPVPAPSASPSASGTEAMVSSSASPSASPVVALPRPRDRMAELAPEERQKLRVARQAVLGSPEFKPVEEKRKTAEQQFRKALRDAMLRVDPALAPVLDKIEASLPAGPAWRR